MLRTIMGFFLAVVIPSVAMAGGATTRPVKVAIVPFDVIGEGGNEWMGRALQEGLATGLEKSAGISAIIVPGLVAADANAAIAQGKSVDADVVIFGSVQVVGQTLRALGRMVAVGSGVTIGTLQSDGETRGLFETEDLLSDRAARILMPVKRTEVSRAMGSATLEVVGPTVATSGPKYFDGDISSVIARPDHFADDADRYYYHSAYTSGYPCSYGYCGPYYCGGCCYAGNGILCPIAAPTRGW